MDDGVLAALTRVLMAYVGVRELMLFLTAWRSLNQADATRKAFYLSLIVVHSLMLAM